MIFSSPEFVFLFLPAVVLLYYLLLRLRRGSLVAPFIFAASLFYYAWWRPQNIWIILASIAVNYGLGQAMSRATRRGAWLALGVTLNLGALAYYKYADFALTTINSLLGSSLPMRHIILPIGISFFTFQQIAYLADIYTGKHDPSQAGEGFIDYCCFVCFFPQLVAGPIVHHQEMMPQFHASRKQGVNWENIFNGLVMFSMGLAKKVIIADQLSPVSRLCFDSIPSMSFLEALVGSLCYTFQLYFDFSAYSDMAIGAALFFNIHLPWNFNSPYKATNIQDFWRRWHITLSRWLKDYLYIPLGGNRRGPGRTLINLFLTFLLGGLWHGAAWTFVLWGALHGAALVAHRVWSKAGLTLPGLLGRALTFGFVSMAWVLFRAPDMGRLGLFCDAFSGRNGFVLSEGFRKGVRGVLNGSFHVMLIGLALVFILALFAPNSSDVLRWPERGKLWLAVFLSIVAVLFICLPTAYPEFIYSQF
ncbi:MAG: MBOAT family protein [Desulfovibrionaceae bacterium]|nr:MBOAT family protein [Desulfovibrionaceae bacterium]